MEASASQIAAPRAAPVERSARFAAELGRQAALALHHAHAQGILHRDVKPSNLLVEKTGWLWVADFGLARISGEGDQTVTGMLMGTLRYMSPEQATGTRGVIDHRTDLYSLGATLYELITLRPAFESDDRLELLTRIVRDDPRPPRRIDPAIPPDLETIVLTAMAKDPGERYASALEMADDLGRFLDGRPIMARPSTFLDIIAKEARRHRSVVITAACFAVLLVASVVGVLTISNSRLRFTNMQLKSAKDRADLNALEADRHRRTAEQREIEADRHLRAFQLRQAKEALDKGQVERTQDILRSIRASRGWASEGTDSASMGFAWHYLMRLASREIVKLSDRQAERVNCLALSTDGRILATGDNDGTIRLRDPATGEVAMSLRGHEHGIWNLAFSPDGRRLVSVGTSDIAPHPGCEILLWEIDSGRLMARLGALSDRILEQIGFDARGEHLWELSSVEGGPWRLGSWDVATDRSHPRLTWSRFSENARPPRAGDGPIVALEGPGPGFRLHDLANAVSRGWTGAIDREQFATGSPDGRMLAVGIAPRVALWDIAAGRERARYDFSPGDSFLAIRFAPDGRFLTVEFSNNRLEILDLRTGVVRTIPPTATVRRSGDFLAFSADSHFLARNESELGSLQPRGSGSSTLGGSSRPIPAISTTPGTCGSHRTAGHSSWNSASPPSAGTIHRHRSPISPADTPTKPGRWRSHRTARPSPREAMTPMSQSGSNCGTLPRASRWQDGTLGAGWLGLAFAPSGRVIASGHFGKEGEIRLWDAASRGASRRCRAIRIVSVRWRSVRIGRRWSAEARITPSGSGTPSITVLCTYSAGTPRL